VSFFKGMPTSEVFAVCGGRRKFNSVRRLRATLRRRDVAALLFRRWTQADIARRLRVHPSTVSRDVKQIFTEAGERCTCPLCGAEYISPPALSSEVESG